VSKIHTVYYYTVSQKRANFEMVWLKIIRIDFEDTFSVWRTKSW